MKRTKALLLLGLMQQHALEQEEKVAQKEYVKQTRKEYRRLVLTLTEAQSLHKLQYFDQRSLVGYHVDHIVSISDGYKYKFPPEWIADISNLQMLPALENMEKGKRSDPIALSEMIARLTFG